MSNKLNEALDHIKLAEKALKTGMFKWNPDYDTAASEYQKAATKFKLAGSSSQSIDSFKKAADMQEKLGSLFHSAKNLAQAASIAADLKQIEESVDLMEKASILYREHGSPDTAAATISKAAKMCESSLPQRSVEMYIKASELCEDDEKLRDASTYLNRAAQLEVKNKRFGPAGEILKKRIELIKTIGNVQLGYGVILALVINYLAEEDYVAAENGYKLGFTLNGFAESDEAAYSEDFLKAFEEGDEELLKRTQTRPTVTHMDTEYARLGKGLKISDIFVGNSVSTEEAVQPSVIDTIENTVVEEDNKKEEVNEWDDDDLC